MTDIIEELTGGGTAPPWLSGPLREAREMAYYAKLVSAIFAILAFLGGIVYIIGAVLGSIWALINAGIGIVFAFVLVFIALNIQRKIINAIDQNRIAQAKSDITLWMILGIVFGLIPGILLFISKTKIDEATATPQYAAPGQAPPAQYNYQQGGYQQPYNQPATAQPAQPQQYGQPQPSPQPYNQPNQPPAYQQPQPQQYQAPPQPVGAAQPQPSQPMGMDGTVICPNCGAQIPPYMHACPKCGAPRPGTQL